MNPFPTPNGVSQNSEAGFYKSFLDLYFATVMAFSVDWVLIVQRVTASVC